MKPWLAAIGPPERNSERMATSLKLTPIGTPLMPIAPPGRSSRSALAHSSISAACSNIFLRISTVATDTARPVM